MASRIACFPLLPNQQIHAILKVRLWLRTVLTAPDKLRPLCPDSRHEKGNVRFRADYVGYAPIFGRSQQGLGMSDSDGLSIFHSIRHLSGTIAWFSRLRKSQSVLVRLGIDQHNSIR